MAYKVIGMMTVRDLDTCDKAVNLTAVGCVGCY